MGSVFGADLVAAALAAEDEKAVEPGPVVDRKGMATERDGATVG